MKFWPWILIAAAVLMSKKSTRSSGNWSQNFSREEFIKSSDSATIPKEAEDSLKAIVTNVLQPARLQLGLPIKINSAYRSPSYNASIGGVPNSQHIWGQAVDVSPVPATAENYKKLWDIITSGPFDQIIWERAEPWNKPSHLHLSYVVPGLNPMSDKQTNRGKKLKYVNGNYSYI
jgi:hypothetical protein